MYPMRCSNIILFHSNLFVAIVHKKIVFDQYWLLGVFRVYPLWPCKTIFVAPQNRKQAPDLRALWLTVFWQKGASFPTFDAQSNQSCCKRHKHSGWFVTNTMTLNRQICKKYDALSVRFLYLRNKIKTLSVNDSNLLVSQSDCKYNSRIKKIPIQL